MKKLGIILSSLILLSSCTTQQQDMQLLQQKFKTVYHAPSFGCCNYIVIDSTNRIYDIQVNVQNGTIFSKVEIK